MLTAAIALVFGLVPVAAQADDPTPTPSSSSSSEPSAKSSAKSADASSSASTSHKSPAAKAADPSDTPATTVPVSKTDSSSSAPSKTSAADDPGTVTPQVVPPATGNNAVITVKVGSDRTGTSGVTNLLGVQLGFFANQTGGTALFTCTSDVDGDCSITVQNTQTGGANRDARYWVRQTAAPSGYFTNPNLGTGTTVASDSYTFQTGTQLRNTVTYRSTVDFMISTGNTNNEASGGVWQDSRVNPVLPAQCGLRVGIIADLSNSVTATDLVNLKGAATTLVTSLTGTPSTVSLFTFATNSPAGSNPVNANRPALMPVSTAAGAATVNGYINNWVRPGDTNNADGGTNWDQALATVAQESQHYDLVVMITDGSPTYYGNPFQGPGNRTRFREVENGIFSANAIKAENTRMLAMGVGGGVSSTAAGLNLRSISGTTLNSDYYQTTDYTAAGNALKALALGSCAGTVTVVKQVVPFGTPANSTAGAIPAGGWTFGGAVTSGVTVSPASGQTATGTGALNFNLTFPGGTTSTTFTGTETQQSGYTLHTISGANAVCTRIDTGATVAVTNNGATGFNVDASSTFPISCTVYNESPGTPATVLVNKVWNVNGTVFANGQQPAELSASLTLNTTAQQWGTTVGGFRVTDSLSIDETTSIAASSLCTLTSSRLTLSNGNTANATLPYSTILAQATNTYLITNTVNCPARLTLIKTVVNGDASPSAWTLTATAPSGALAGPTGTTGVTGAVTPLVTYPLSENNADPRYVQLQGTGAVAIPGSTISWFCSQVNPTTGAVIPGFSDGLNGGVTVPSGFAVRCEARNQTAELTLLKHVVNDNGGTATASDWNLTATPTDPPAGLLSETVIGAETTRPENTIYVRPGHPYNLTESAVAGYTLTGISCVTSTVGAPRELSSITLQVGESGVCTYTNDDQPAHLTLVKTVTNDNGGTATAGQWTLAAGGPTPISGSTGSAAVTNAPVSAGTYTLSESGGPAGYAAGSWSCTAGTLTGSSLVLPLDTSATCTINNNDQPAHLTLIKTVTNDNGGTAVPTAWTLAAAGPTPISGATGSATVTNAPVNAGTYTLSESGGPAGYAAGTWSCSAGTLTGSSLVLPLNTSATCTINNNDVTAHLTLVKVVDANETGSGMEPKDWTLTATPVDITGQNPVTGNGDPSSGGGVNAVPVFAGQYTLTEQGPAGFTSGDWECDGGVFADGNVSVPNGGDVVCTITNTAVSPKLTLIKIVDNGTTGATTAPTAWELTATGPTSISGATGSATVTAANVKVGTYDLSESGEPGYTASDWVCTGADSSTATSVTLTEGQDATCTITNTAVAPRLTLVKVVDNGTTGATATPAQFTLTAANGASTITGPGNSAAVTDQAAIIGTYALSETTLDGYAPSGWVCTGGTATTVASVTLALGGDATCTITNTAVPPSWTLAKTADPPSGTSVNPGDTIAYTLTATNTGELPLVGATATDNLTNVLAFADLGSLPPELTRSGNTLTWAIPTVPVGGEVTVSFSVTVHDGALDVHVHNVATPGENGTCATGCETDHPTPPPWTLTKTASPGTGVEVNPGSTITYTLTATNNGKNTLTGATATDDLSQVLPYADLGTLPPSGELTRIGNTLTWAIPNIEGGGTRTVSFSVSVHDDAFDVHVHNLATPTSPGGECTENCETDHPTPPPWTLEKTADPASGTTVEPGSTITYTLTAANTGENTLTGATATDDLAQVLPYADLGTLPPSGELTLTGNTLTWAIPDIEGGGTRTVSFSATVHDDALDVHVHNLATPTSPGGDCVSEGGCETDHPTTPPWTLAKTADPASGTRVDPDTDITYTLTAKNTGADNVLTGAKAEDDLSQVLTYADVVTLGPGLSQAGNTLIWEIPDLAPGEPATVTFTVHVKENAYGITIHNLATPTSPGGECVSETGCETDHPTPPRWVLNKSADPASGSMVQPGSTITYTLLAQNVALGPLTGAQATDDLSAVLNYADLVQPLPPTLTLSGTTLTWAVPDLPVDGRITISYQVKVHDDAHGVTIHNLATPTTPGGACEPLPAPELTTLALTPAAVRAAADPADVCETDHMTPTTWSLTKSADPKSGTTVAPGSTITYTLTARNTSQAVVSNATATDNLSKVLSAATLVTPLADRLTRSGTTLTWALPDIPVGGTVTVKYAVKVDADALGVTLTNLATPTSPGGTCTSDPACTTTHDTPPAWTLKKTSDPASGTDVDAGSTIKYTLTATNAGKAVVTGAKAKDDLSKVTPFADVRTPLPAGLTRSGNTLTWAIPDIPVGKSVSVSFTVKVHSDASNVTVANHATVATPDGRCTSCSTHHHVPKEPPLASTGVPVGELVGWASFLVLLGGLLIVGGRRRRTS